MTIATPLIATWSFVHAVIGGDFLPLLASTSPPKQKIIATMISSHPNTEFLNRLLSYLPLINGNSGTDPEIM